MEAVRGIMPDAALDALLNVVLNLLEESFDHDDEKMHHAVRLIAEHLHRSIDPEWGSAPSVQGQSIGTTPF
jgi:hypothetical protein